MQQLDDCLAAFAACSQQHTQVQVRWHLIIVVHGQQLRPLVGCCTWQMPDGYCVAYHMQRHESRTSITDFVAFLLSFHSKLLLFWRAMSFMLLVWYTAAASCAVATA